MATIKNYRDLDVWHDAMNLVEQIYRLTARFPDTERFGLVTQMRRAAVSIPANIAEGAGRWQLGPYVQHLLIARGSAYEVETLTLLAPRVDVAPAEDTHQVLEQVSKVGRRLTRLIRALERLRPSAERRAPSTERRGPSAERRVPSTTRSPHPPLPAPP